MSNFSNGPQRKYRFKLAGKLDQWLDLEGIHYKTSSTGEIIIESCPMCGKSFKLYLSEETGVGQCKYAACDFNNGVNPVKIIAALKDCSEREAFQLAFDEIVPKGPININSDDEEDSLPEESYVRIKKTVEVPDAQLPEVCVDLDKTLHEKAWNYLINRGYSDEIISKLNLKIVPYYDYKILWAELMKQGFSHDKIKKHLRYMNRIIFPLYINGVIKGYIARSFIPIDESMKVMNSEGNFRAQFFWNYDNLKSAETVLICEGISDAVKCGIDRSLALLGTAAAEGQLELIRTLTPNKVILALDIGTEKNQLYIYERLASYFPGEMYSLELPPLLTQKEDLLNERIKEALEELCAHDINYFKPNELHLPYYVYLDVKNKIKQNWFSSLKDEDQTRLQAFFKGAKYKDAGDYSFEEMDEFVKKAKKVSKDYYEHRLEYYRERNLKGF